MRNLFQILALSLTCFVLGSCEKEEVPVTLPEATGQLIKFNVGKDYNSQVYVDLEQGVVKSFNNNEWDLAFDCGDDNFIQINGGNNVLIAMNTTSTDLNDKINKSGLKWKWDEANGWNDSLALTGWQKRADSIYFIDRGMTYKSPERYFQFKVSQLGNDSYKITFTNEHGEELKEHIITKDRSKTLVYFSFLNGGEFKNIEPDKSQWDLCFLSYRWIYYEFNPPLLYRVVGTYINNHYLSVTADSTGKAFENIEAADFDRQQFSTDRDAIGFDWKVPLFQGTDVSYNTRQYVSYYVRKKQSGLPDKLYKIRFIDFYDDKGVKGSPAFEVKRLR